MFEISWSELLLLAIVTLVFVGPKELPAFLRTIGRYAGMVRRQANEFKSQFDAAMREADLDVMNKELAELQSKVNAEVMSASKAADDVKAAVSPEAMLPATPPTAAAPSPAAAGSSLAGMTVSSATPAASSVPMPAPPRVEP